VNAGRVVALDDQSDMVDKDETLELAANGKRRNSWRIFFCEKAPL